MSDAARIEIPNYRLVKCVGHGGFGEVWLAEEVLTRIYRAVKIVPAKRTKRSRTELDGVRQYQQRTHGHPHLVQVLTVGETSEGALYYVMEAADNALGSRAASPEDYEAQTLATVLDRDGRLPLDAALEYATAILDAVEHLHRNGLAHRDLKPQNVLFVDGALKLADVGLASRDAGAAAGTPGYRTPEGTADDLHALGVILYQMITGQPTWSFPELPADLDRTHDPRQLKHVLRLIDRACHPEADRRFESPTQFLDAVRRAAGMRPIRAGRKTAALVAAALLVLVLVIVWLVAARWDVPDWSDLEFVVAPNRGEWTAFSQGDQRPSGFRLDSGSLGREGNLMLSGPVEVGFAQPNAIMALMLAAEDEIVHVIYYGKPEEGGRQRQFEDQLFHLPDRLKRFAGRQTCPFYLVLAPTDDFFGFCEQYASREYDPANRILIGHIQRMPGR